MAVTHLLLLPITRARLCLVCYTRRWVAHVKEVLYVSLRLLPRDLAARQALHARQFAADRKLEERHLRRSQAQGSACSGAAEGGARHVSFLG